MIIWPVPHQGMEPVKLHDKRSTVVQQVSVRLGGDWRWILAQTHYWTGAHTCVQMGRRGKPFAEENANVLNTTGYSDMWIRVE